MIVDNLWWRQLNQWTQLASDDALVLTTRELCDLVCGKSIEWNSLIWFASLDLARATCSVAGF